MIGLFVYLIPPVALLALGYFWGTAMESSHLRDLSRREHAFRHIGITNLKRPAGGGNILHAEFVNGQSVIASDYFKTFLAGIRQLFGGRMRSFETLLMRARREALLRLIEEADRMGANEVCNVRFETSRIGNGSGNRGLPSAEVHAYGTAIVRNTAQRTG
jgi:uncharacterized protein YbjQ (UPF0145 family)